MVNTGILSSVSDRVGIIALDRPEVLNAIDRGMRLRLHDLVDEMDRDDGVGAIVITGQGSRAFCVGGNLNEMREIGPAEAEEIIVSFGRLYKRIRRTGKPIVAAVNGIAVGAGFQLAMLADIRIGHPGVRLGQPEINAGMPTALGPYLMTSIVGRARAMELTLTGRLVDAPESELLGLLHRLVKEEDVLSEARKIARDMASKPPGALALQKQHFADASEAEFDMAIAAGRTLMRQAYKTGEPQAMIGKTLRKTKPAASEKLD